MLFYICPKSRKESLASAKGAVPNDFGDIDGGRFPAKVGVCVWWSDYLQHS
jgi:hypothetical protein